ncbi:hypothetical protein TKK_0014322 [Trichogramma kaykai]
MFSCNYAGCKSVFSWSKDLCFHLKNTHSYQDGTSLKCNFNECRRDFCFLSSFQRHLKNHEVSKDQSVEVPNQNSQSIPYQSKLDNAEIKRRFHESRPDTKKDLEKISSSFVVELFRKTLTREEINEVVLETSKWKTALLKTLRDLLLKTFDQDFGHYEAILDKIFILFDESLDKFDSDYKRIEYFEELKFYVPPKACVIGQVEVQKLQNNEVVVFKDNVCGQHVSIEHTIQTFFEIGNNMKIILSHMHKVIQGTNTDNISDFMSCG